jgi:DNA-binding MarR family transcriptional regulator
VLVSDRDDPAEDVATRTWRAVRGLVFDHDRRQAVAEALGISFARVKVLRALAGGPATMRELADRIGADAPYVTLMVDDLEGRELVTRSPHPRDRRAKLVSLTPAGRRAAERAQRLLDEPPEAWRAVPAHELERLERLLAAATDRGFAGRGA